jgi:2-polyprenyl-3-methyl-5-hydroxy-6-metoxy-1,4-benzoquinol methylase
LAAFIRVMKYYYKEHLEGYRKIKEEGKTSWGEIHGYPGFENFASRTFLEEFLPRLYFSDPNPTVLECGCGTGPCACFLAERGFRVDAIDLIPGAIDIAGEMTGARGLDIHYAVLDVCELPHKGRKYDMIVDSYCLQCIVTAEDRKRVFAGVRARLKPKGYYLISTAMFDEERFRPDKLITDAETGTVYHVYDENEIIDMTTSIVLRKLDDKPDAWEDAVRINGVWYLPVRRHWKPADLRLEVEAMGFDVIYQDEETGDNVVAILR